jgi:hypothetical protein
MSSSRPLACKHTLSFVSKLIRGNKALDLELVSCMDFELPHAILQDVSAQTAGNIHHQLNPL